MIDNLTEAIAHCNEKAKEQRTQAELSEYTDLNYRASACLECAKEHEQLAEWLTELQERREADRWIPISERLPEKAGEYLCSLHYAIPPYHMLHPEKDVYVDDARVKSFDGTAFDSSVIAWKPLPELYKESEDE